MAIITCRSLNLSFGEERIFRDVSFNIEAGDRLCITGSNGSGKSTLLRVLNSELQLEEGSLWFKDNLTISVLPQTLPEVVPGQTIYDAVAEALSDVGDLLAQYHHLLSDSTNANSSKLATLHDQIEHADGWSVDYKISSALSRLQLDPDQLVSELSGGWLRRVAIAKSLVIEPDVWILDEPTNHLDITAIEWLETVLLDYPGALVFVSHDRELMTRVANAILDIDRGKVQRFDCPYETYLDRKADLLELEQQETDKLDARLAKEEQWIRQGIKARRTRNEGRVRALVKLREERRQRSGAAGSVKLAVDQGDRSGKIVKELHGVSKSFGDTPIIRDLDLILRRGDRLGIVGPNGCGKSTLLKILLEREQPDSGSMTSGTKLQIAYFDQIRGTLDPEKSVADTIVDGREFVTINDNNIHVVTYLQNFLFTPDHARSPVRTLSGGEQNRLLLAKLFSLPANLLVLDEPTNDLDIQSLELLEELLMDYEGTVLLVTHDRSFLDHIITNMLVFEGDGQVTEYVGGYSEWRDSGHQFPDAISVSATASGSQSSADIVSSKPKSRDQQKADKRIAQKRQRELDQLPAKIEAAENKIGQLHETIGSPGFYDRRESEQSKILADLEAEESTLETLFELWETLEK